MEVERVLRQYLKITEKQYLTLNDKGYTVLLSLNQWKYTAIRKWLVWNKGEIQSAGDYNIWRP